MNFYIPDEHPGRCPTWRTISSNRMRCLKVAGHAGLCRWPEPPRLSVTDNPSVVYTTPKREPWIEPPEARRQSFHEEG